MAAILDITHNAMTKVHSGHTRMSDILENPTWYTKSMLALLFCPKLYQFIVLPLQVAAILDFIRNAMFKDFLTTVHHYVRHN